MWDCVRYFKESEELFTEADWVDKYDAIYGFYCKRDRMAAMALNADEATFRVIYSGS